MKIGFDNIYEQIIPMEDFRLEWRFTDGEYDNLPEIHLEQLKPLNEKGAQFIWDFISDSGVHNHTPFQEGFFKTIDKAKILESNEKEIKKWLYQRGIPFEKEVFLSWQPDNAMMVPWKLLIKYFRLPATVAIPKEEKQIKH